MHISARLIERFSREDGSWRPNSQIEGFYTGCIFLIFLPIILKFSKDPSDPKSTERGSCFSDYRWNVPWNPSRYIVSRATVVDGKWRCSCCSVLSSAPATEAVCYRQLCTTTFQIMNTPVNLKPPGITFFLKF